MCGIFECLACIMIITMVYDYYVIIMITLFGSAKQTACILDILHVFVISADQPMLIMVANELKMQFKQKRFHSPDDIEDIWQMLYPEHFINVLLIHHIRQRKEEDIKEVACIMRDGLAHYDDTPSFQFFEHLFALRDDQFYHKKFETSKISDMFEPFKNEDGSTLKPKLILIDGAPGMGKTTLCKEIAYRWANAELLMDSSIVFLLFLRDPGIQKIHDVKNLIHYFYSFEPSCEGLAKQCAEILAKRDNSDITIVMDGYDEFNDKDNDLLIGKIIKRKILSQCRIVITSRPIASEKLQKLADVRVEVLGFNKQSKRQYIQKELKDYPKKIRSLLSYLDKHSSINQLCYVPIMMTIMVCSFKQYEELPTNESEVYERFVTLAISYCLHKLDNKEPTSILSLNKLPVKYQIYMQQLTEFAFKTLEDGKVIFNNDDIERLSPYLALHSKELQGLGLLKATEHFSIKDMNKYVWFNFLHLSVHEFLAAHYLKSLKPSEQFQILKKTFFIKHYINVWDMFIGLQESNTYNFHQFVTYSYVYGASDEAKDEMTLILQKLDLHHFPEIHSINFKSIDGTYQLFCSKNNKDDSIDIAQQMIATTFDAKHLLQLYGWYFISNITQLFVSLCSVDSNDQLIEMYFVDKSMQYATYCQAISELEQNQNISVMLVGRDTLVGYRCNCHQLTNALNMNTSLEYVILKYCLINYEVANTLSSYLLNSHHVKHLSITNSKIVSKLVPLKAPLQTVKEKCTIKVLNFKSNDISTEVVKDLASIIKQNTNLEQLYLADNDFKTSSVLILQAIKENSKLQLLNLNSNNMTGKAAEVLASVIKNNSNLERLYLANNNLRKSSILILQALKENSNLQLLDLNGNKVTGEAAENLASVIKNNSNLEQLGLANNDLRTSSILILQALKENSNLQLLDLNDNKVTGEAAEDLASVIKNNSNLERLHLANNDLRKSSILILQALKENSNLQLLDLNDNKVTGEAADDLAIVIKNNSNLEQLGLANNDLKTSSILILQALKEISKLKVLNLNDNNITDQAAEDLASVIKNNSNLERLHLANNDLRKSSILILQALKENSNLQLLDLYGNKVTGEAAEDLASVIKNNSNLEQLGLANNDLKTSSILILQALKENSNLQRLDLNGNKVTGEAAEDLASVIKNNSNLEQLGLANNDLKTSSVLVLQALKEISKLKDLNLNGNNITGEAAEDLASVIKNNSNLEQLYLANNNLRTSSILILQALKENSNLQLLDLNDNKVTGEAAEDLASVIKNNSNLEQLYLANNNLRTSSVLILQAMKENCKLKTLNLNGNNMTGEAAEDLASVIKNNSNLERLHLANNDLRKSSILILQALKENSNLQLLVLNGNKVTGEAAEDLASVIKNNSNLEQLGLANNDLKTSSVLVLQALKEISKLKDLNLNGNNITGEAAEDLASVIKNNSNLERLHLANNDLRKSSILILQALKENSNLQLLDLNGNKVTGEAAENLASVIKNNSNLEQLGLANNDLKTSSFLVLQALKEISKLKVLNLNGNNITGEAAEDLASVIKNNSNLEQLYLANNNLRTSSILILQAMKENCKLKTLNLSGNNMTGEAAEDLASVIKNNSNLEHLHLANNDLRRSSILILQALKENSNLQLLDLNGNKVTGEAAEDLASVIKNNSNLEQLGLANNDLKTSSFLVLQALKEISKLKVLNLNGNNITGEAAEDLASVIKNNSNLEQLYLANNNLRTSSILILQAMKENCKLKTLNLNDNNMTGEAAEDLASVIKNNSNLERLHLANNNLRKSSILILQALKENSNLQLLDLNGNKVTGEAAENLASVIKNNSNLEQLGLANNDLRTSSILILQAMKENSKLKALNLNGNNMTGEAAEDLASVIKNNSNLEQLGLANNDLKTSSVLVLQALKEISKLKDLNLNDNNITDQAAEDLASVIKNNSNLEQLYLANNDLKTSSVLILQALKENSKLTVLNLNDNNMTGEAAEDLASVIKNNSNLEWLYLANNDLKTSSVLILQALKENSKLTVLNLNDNNMTGEAAEDLASVIKNNSNLEQIGLANNDLKTSSVLILQALKENSKLKALNLNGNNMTGEAAEDLASVTKNNSNLEQLYLANNDLKTSSVLILQALKENSKLTVLNLNDNNMTGEAAEDLASVIKCNSNLEWLYLGYNNLKASGVLILRALQKNTKLKVLNLNNNGMTGKVAEDIAGVIKNNSNLEELYLSNNNFNTSGVLILQALKSITHLRILALSNNLLHDSVTELTATELLSNNPLITELFLGGNMLQNQIIDITRSSNSLKDLQVMELSHNNVNPMNIIHLVSLVTNANMLQVLLISGLILNIKERFHVSVFQFYDANKQRSVLQNNSNSSENTKLEIFCLEVWRLQFAGRVKLNYESQNYFPTNNITMQAIPIDMNLNFISVLSIAKLGEQKLSKLDATNLIFSLSSIIKALKVLDLGYNNINNEAAVQLATALKCNNVLEQLWLRGNVLGADGAAVILSSLQNITTLRVLDLSYNNISSRSANGIAAVINSNHFLEQLWLDGNMLMTTGVVIIASALKKHSNLTLLNLSNNEITEDAAEEISAIVNSKNLLGGLLLSNNQLQFTHLSKTTKSHGGIKFLHILELSNNFINATAADELAVTLSNCVCLKELYLGNNNLGTTGGIKIIQAVKNILILQVLSLNNNNITTEAASEICNVINTNTNLDILLLGGNDLQTSGVLQIADTVKNNNPTMQLLSLSDNNVDAQVKEDIKVMLCDQCDLELFI